MTAAPNPYRAILDVCGPESFTDAQRSIESALVELLNQTEQNGSRVGAARRSAELPSVKDLCAHAFVARSTFYVHYHHVDEVLETLEHRLVHDLASMNQSLMDKSPSTTGRVRFSLRETLQYIRANQPAFHALLIATPDNRFIEDWKTAIKYQCWERMFGGNTMTEGVGAIPAGNGDGSMTNTDGASDTGDTDGTGGTGTPRRPIVNRELILEIVASAMVTATTFWLRHPDQVHEQGVDDIVNMVIGALDTVI